MIAAVIGVAFLDVSAPRPWSIEGSRTIHLDGALAELNSGGIPLWGKFTMHVGGSALGSGGYYYGPTSPGDDQGAFLYVPELAHALGLSDPLTAMRILYLALLFIPLVAYPLMFARLFSSTAAGVVAPWALLVGLRVLGFHDIYWIVEWAIFALLPPLMLLARRWPRPGLVWLSLLVVGASFANSIRAQSGLGVLLAAVIVVFLRPWKWRWRIAVLPLLAVAYLSISSFAFAGVRAIRTDDLGHPITGEVNSHLVWHPLYLGLGYLPNEYGIKWNDAIAADAVARYDPRVHYPTAAYDAAVRHLFLKLVRSDPGLFIRSTAAKFLVSMWQAVPGFLLLGLVGLFRAATRRRDPPLLRTVVLVIPAALVGLAPAVLTIPYEELNLGWLSSVGLCCILAVCWIAAWLGSPGGAWAQTRALVAAVAEWMSKSVIRPVALVGTIVVLIAIAVGARSIENRSNVWQASPTPAVSTTLG